MKVALSLVTLTMASSLLAGGFEKATQWSAESAAHAGAVSSSVKSSEALYFNPAGLATPSLHEREVSLSVTPTYSHFKAPFDQNDREVSSNPKVKTPFALLGHQQLTDRLGMGLGFYSAGGSESEYKNLSFEGFSMKPSSSSSLMILESSLGLGYKVTPEFSLGASYRASFIHADMSSASLSNLGNQHYILTSLRMKDLSDTNWSGYRLGAQYQTQDKNFGIGATYRSAISFNAKTKKVSGEAEFADHIAAKVTPKGEVSVENSFPQQFSLDLHKVVTPEVTLFAGYTWTQYSVNKQLKLKGKFDLQYAKEMELPSIEQNWHDQHNIRFAVEDRHFNDLKLRAGYVYTTAVTDQNAARGTFSSPAPAHTLLLGAGHDFMKGDLVADAAFEYSFARGQGITNDGAKSPRLSGNFQTDAMALYTTLKYSF